MRQNLLIPLYLFEPPFKSLSAYAKLLYGLILMEYTDNPKVDKNGRKYVEYSRTRIKEDLNVANDKARDILNELEKAGLIEKEAITGKNARIYPT